MQDGQDVYLEVFQTELEAFKHRVKEYAVRCEGDAVDTNCTVLPKEALDSLSPVSASPHITLQLLHTAGRWQH